MAVDWSELPPELLDTIAKKLKVLKDRIRFRAVCVNWRSSTPEIPINLPCQVPWLMLPADRSSNKESHFRCFFGLSNDKVHSLAIPQLSHWSRRCGSSHGWLAVLNESPSIFLLNPLSRSVINLTPLSSFPNHRGNYFLGCPIPLLYNPHLAKFCSLIVISIVSFSTDKKMIVLTTREELKFRISDEYANIWREEVKNGGFAEYTCLPPISVML